MFCGNAAGQMLPPYFVYPEPKPKGYNPLSGALKGADIAYTQKGWMNKYLENSSITLTSSPDQSGLWSCFLTV
jgi:hypothetical protein